LKNIDFWMDFVVGYSNKLQKLGLEGKISWVLNVFTLGPIAQVTIVAFNSFICILLWGQLIYIYILLYIVVPPSIQTI
jgi:hypothetical protein